MQKLPSETERKLVTLSIATTDNSYGKEPEKRTMEEYLKYGFINLNKPQGPTSYGAVARVKRILGVKKAGHGGTLDSNVSGVLPVALEESTKVLGSLLSAGKEYVGMMHIHEEVDEERIKAVFSEFEGDIIQRPPVRSSVKRQLRKRRIYYLEFFGKDGKDGKDVQFRVGCEAGTYIRKLCNDIGEVLGTGAHMVELRRTKSGSLTDDNMVTLDGLRNASTLWKEKGVEEGLRKVIMPVEKVVSFLPKVIVRDSAVDAICHGAPLAVPGITMLDTQLEKGKIATVLTLKGELVATGIAMKDTAEILSEGKGIAVKTDRVLMKLGTYPKFQKRCVNDDGPAGNRTPVSGSEAR